MSEKSDRRKHLFVVRVWQEPSQAQLPGQVREGEAGGAAKTGWRGSVEHVPSGERAYFGALADLASFIAKQLDVDGMSTE